MLTLGNQRDLTNDMLIKGIIDSVVTVNQFYQMLPFKGIQGNALAYNRETVGADQQALVDVLRTGVTGINKTQQTFTRHSTELTTIIGDAQVNGLIQAVGSDFNDATAVQVAAKAKGIGRQYMNLLINGNEGGEFADNSVVSLADVVLALLVAVKASLNTAAITASTTFAQLSAAGAVVTFSNHTGGVNAPMHFSVIVDAQDGTDSDLVTLSSNGAAALNAAALILNGFQGFDGMSALSGTIVTANTGTEGTDRLEGLDLLIDRIHDKDGMVDYMMMNSAGVRKITAAFRSVGTGFDMMDVKTSSGAVMSVQSYRGVPIFRNDFIGGDSTTNRANLDGGDNQGANATTDIYVGTLDDGSMTHGICGLTALKSAGMQVQKLGAREDVDADITRVKWYCGLAHFSELGLVKGSLA